eukprot:15457385-Alexandrium_andersonii.AAC.1
MLPWSCSCASGRGAAPWASWTEPSSHGTSPARTVAGGPRHRSRAPSGRNGLADWLQRALLFSGGEEG